MFVVGAGGPILFALTLYQVLPPGSALFALNYLAALELNPNCQLVSTLWPPQWTYVITGLNGSCEKLAGAGVETCHIFSKALWDC